MKKAVVKEIDLELRTIRSMSMATEYLNVSV